MEVYILVALFCAAIGLFINGGVGAILGLLFGPIGLIISAVLKDKES